MHTRYDTSEHSPNLAPAYGSFDAEDVQGMWLVRTFMYLALAKIDRAQMFMLADVQVCIRLVRVRPTPYTPYTQCTQCTQCTPYTPNRSLGFVMLI